MTTLNCESGKNVLNIITIVQVSCKWILQSKQTNYSLEDANDNPSPEHKHRSKLPHSITKQQVNRLIYN